MRKNINKTIKFKCPTCDMPRAVVKHNFNTRFAKFCEYIGPHFADMHTSDIQAYQGRAIRSYWIEEWYHDAHYKSCNQIIYRRVVPTQIVKCGQKLLSFNNSTLKIKRGI